MGRGWVFQLRLIVLDNLLVPSLILGALNHAVAVHETSPLPAELSDALGWKGEHL